jgi:predicted nucleotidyltransferase
MKDKQPISRDRIVQALAEAFEALDFVYAMWEGGAVAFGRIDEWSDIDICLDAEDERGEEVFPVAERVLERISPIELKYDVPSPTLGEYVQAFYRLRDASRFMVIDLAVFKHSAKDKLLEPEIHGQALFHFNKNNAVRVPSLDRGKFLDGLQKRLERIRIRFDMFKCFVEKELRRGNHIEALDLYHRLVLDSLVEALRMKHKPVRHGFRTRYIYYDLPADIVDRLEDLYFVGDKDDLSQKYAAAVRWFRQISNQP